MINYSTLTEAMDTVKNGDRTITFIEGKLDHRVLSYAQLYKNSMRLLYDLQEVGLKQGDQLIVFTKNNQYFVEVFWACLFGGIVPVPLAVGISGEHKAKFMRVFNKLERPYVFTEQEYLDRLDRFAGDHDMHESFAVVRNKTILADLLDEHDLTGEIQTVQPEDVAFIQFSSGSTSEPKGVVLTHKNIMTNLKALTIGAEYCSDDISLSWMPLTHDLGLLGFHLNMVLVNISQCLMPTDLFSRRPMLWLQKASELKVTVTCSPNFGYKHFLKALDKKPAQDLDLSPLRLIFNGAEPISLVLCEEFLTRLAPYGLRHESILTVYGLAEATLAVAFPPVTESYQSVYIDRHHVRLGDSIRLVDKGDADAVGFAIEGPAINDIEIKITNGNNTTLNANQIGLVQIKGPSVTKGFYLDEEANHAAFTGDGWLNTGDLGLLNEKNELVITGREKDIIFANAQNYYPHDIESVAMQLPELELNKVVAYGLRQANGDTDDLLVFILFRGEVKDFIGIVRDVTRHINEQMGLEVTQVIPVNRIPKTTSGKLQRRMLGDDYLKGEYDEKLHLIESLLAEINERDTGDFSNTEYRLKMLFEGLLEGKSLGIEDNFFETGISSLTLTEFHQKLDDHYPGLVDITDIFEYQTLVELAKFVDEKSVAN